MTSQETATRTDFESVVDVLRTHDRFVVVTHENPDGDALGSMLGAVLGLRSLGKDVVMYLAGEAPVPGEYGFLDLDGLLREAPEDAEGGLTLISTDAPERFSRIAGRLFPAFGDGLAVELADL